MEYAGLVVADDLTGAMDTGNEFARRGYVTTVALDARVEDPDATVAVANTDSRYLPETEAAAAVRTAVRSHPAAVVYKKVDSTLRGNLGAEVDAVLDATSARVAVVAPAFPAGSRTTEDGVHRVNRTPVAETAAGRDPDKPVPTSRLPALFAECAHPVVHLPLPPGREEPEAVAETLTEAAERHGTAIVTCDATDEDRLATVAEGASVSGLEVVYVGSAGLAKHVAIPGVEPIDGENRPKGTEAGDDRVLGIAGSTNPVTIEQVRAVADDVRVDLDLRRIVVDPEAAVDEAAGRCLNRLQKGNTALLTTVGGERNVALRVGRDTDVTEREVRERISRGLGAVARRVHRDVGVTGVFLTGGAVAVDVLGALGTDDIRLTGAAVGTGVPVGTLVGGEANGTAVITKAGAFGERGTIANCLASLRHDDE